MCIRDRYYIDWCFDQLVDVKHELRNVNVKTPYTSSEKEFVSFTQYVLHVLKRLHTLEKKCIKHQLERRHYIRYSEKAVTADIFFRIAFPKIKIISAFLPNASDLALKMKTDWMNVGKSIISDYQNMSEFGDIPIEWSTEMQYIEKDLSEFD